MAFDLIRVSVVGSTPSGWRERLRLRGVAATEADDFAFCTLADEPQVIVSLGDPAAYPGLLAAPLETRKRWIAVDSDADPADVADRIMATVVANLDERFPDEPLVSVVTPTRCTGERIERTYQSLLAQAYHNWEWVVYDDSPDDGETFVRLAAIARHDQRVAAVRADHPSGKIGQVKRRAFGLATGALLVELDHDDELTPDALGWVAAASRAHPDAGFFYSDCAEVGPDGSPVTYPDGWAFGYGSYRAVADRVVANYPPINPRTIRHIVGAPNHVRAWTTVAYHAAGGHSPELHVADDYELLLRTFLTTAMVHIRRCCYIQHHAGDGSQAQRRRNRDIQRLVRFVRVHYDDRLHARFVALGIDDWLWRDGRLAWDAVDPDPAPFANRRWPA